MRDNKGQYINSTSKSELIIRVLWYIVRAFFFRTAPSKLFRRWRNFLLRCFGAKVHPDAYVYSSARIMNPWNLEMGKLSCIGPHVVCENDVIVTLEENATVSQYTYLCTASHDITDSGFNLLSRPIVIKKDEWVAAEVFIGMGVTIGEGAVVGARAAVFWDVEPWKVVGGNPVKVLKNRKMSRNMNSINQVQGGANLKIKVASCRPLSIFATLDSPLTTYRFYGERREAA